MRFQTSGCSACGSVYLGLPREVVHGALYACESEQQAPEPSHRGSPSVRQWLVEPEDGRAENCRRRPR